MLNKAEDKRDQYEMISVSELVPKDHLLRKVDKVLDLNFVYELVEDKYCLDNGRPSIDPVILVKILLIQRLFGIKSMMCKFVEHIIIAFLSRHIILQAI